MSNTQRPQPSTTPRTPTEASSPAEAPAGADHAAVLMRGPMDVALQQGAAWLRGLEELYRLQLNTAHMAAQRLEDLHQRLQQAATSTDALALQAELVQFESAAALRFAQEVADIGMRALGQAGAQLADAALRAAPTLPKLDPLVPLSLFHTGIHPFDDLFGAALNRYLMPNTAA